MSAKLAKKMYKMKFTGCISIQPLKSILGTSTFCSNYCYVFLDRSLLALHSRMVTFLLILHGKIAPVLISLVS